MVPRLPVKSEDTSIGFLSILALLLSVVYFMLLTWLNLNNAFLALKAGRLLSYLQNLGVIIKASFKTLILFSCFLSPAAVGFHYCPGPVLFVAPYL